MLLSCLLLAIVSSSSPLKQEKKVHATTTPLMKMHTATPSSKYPASRYACTRTHVRPAGQPTELVFYTGTIHTYRTIPRTLIPAASVGNNFLPKNRIRIGYPKKPKKLT